MKSMTGKNHFGYKSKYRQLSTTLAQLNDFLTLG